MNNKFTTIACLVVATGAIQLENKLDAQQCCYAPCGPSCAQPCDCEAKVEEPEVIELIPADLLEPEPEVEEDEEPEEAEEPEEPVEAEQAEPEPTRSKEEKPKVEVYETTVDEMEEETSLADILREANGRPLILDFQYDSCPPCQDIAPEFEQLMDDYAPNAVFKKVDVMKHRELLTELGVSSLPTFKVWVNGMLSNTVLGADIVSLSDAIDEAVETYQTTKAEEEAEAEAEI